MQIDAWERGFSYSYDAPLDMRMDPRQSFTAADLVNEWPESRIAQVLRRFGEERHAGGIAREIVARRPLRTTADLVAAINAGMPASARFGGGHPAKRTFQALRIAVNGELDLLNEALPLAWDALPLGGRFAAISFHSLEDRPGKQFLAKKPPGCFCPPELPVCVCGHEPEAELLTRRAIAPGPEEVEENPRSRSAHLRAAVKIALDTRLAGDALGGGDALWRSPPPRPPPCGPPPPRRARRRRSRKSVPATVPAPAATAAPAPRRPKHCAKKARRNANRGARPA